MGALSIIAGVVVGLAALAWWWLFRFGLPKIHGTFVVEGLSGEVEVFRDVHGVAHIFASSIADVAYGQGFVHAQDRLWQMELNRRVGSGRLSEFAGAAALQADRMLRRIGLRRAAETEAAQLLPDERAVLEAYARGVNAAVKAMGRRLPLELRLLGIKPEPWQPADSLVWAKAMALNLATNWEMELFRARLVAKVGVARAVELDLGHSPGEPVIVAAEAASAQASAEELSRLYDELKPYLAFGATGASNNWVVSGARTATGKPLLANDPHLALQIPSVWYEAHLVAPGLDVYGVSLPGAPGVILGHNRQVAWGFTNSNADVQDLYIERFIDRDSYETPHGPAKAERIREVIRVKGAADVVEEVVVTRHGPVLAGAPIGGEGPALALRWTSLDPGHTVAAILAMDTATDAKAFRDALRRWQGPSQNVVFADVNGDIGYLMAGDVPIRAKGSGFTPVPGWTGEWEWTGMIPFDELPQLWNPPSGIVATANNAVVDRGFPHHISWDWMNGYRAGRIVSLLKEKDRLGPDDFSRIQRDVYCEPGLRFARGCSGLKPDVATERAALSALLQWDGYATAESVGTSVYEAMLLAAVQLALAEELGPELFHKMLGGSNIALFPVNLMLGRANGRLVESIAQGDTGLLRGSRFSSWEALLGAALSDACRELTRRLGPDVSRWAWGRLHRLAVRHPLSAVKPLNLIFKGADFPVGGDTDTPFQTAYLNHKPFGAEAWAPSWRQIADLADLRKTLSVHLPGQSGHPRTRHAMDLLPLWREGRFHPQWLDRAEIEAHGEARLRLVPR